MRLQRWWVHDSQSSQASSALSMMCGRTHDRVLD
jgi:hypothetical protein